MRGLFIDTSTQIARHWHSDSERSEIKDQLKGHTLYCSHYVKCQYKATLLNAAIHLYNLTRHFEDLTKALQEAKRYSNKEIAGGSLTKGVQDRIIDIGLWVLRKCKHYEEQLQRIEDIIEDTWETFFLYRIILPLIDETDCRYVNSAPERSPSGAYKPIEVKCTQRSPHECKIEEFWDNHRRQLEDLAHFDVNRLESESIDKQELQGIKDHAQRIIAGNRSHGRRCTVTLSDAIICLESQHCPESSAVHSTNKKHFQPLCEILGIESKP